MDFLSPLFAQFSLSARVFFSGRLCGLSDEHTAGAGHLHLLRKGTLRAIGADRRVLTVKEPSVLFYPRPMQHRLRASEERGAEIVCAEIDFGVGMHNPLLASLADAIVIPLRAIPELGPAVEILFSEAFGRAPGRGAALNRLTEYFLILLLRSAIQSGLLVSGVLKALADPRLTKALAAMHQHPEEPWSLAALADTAGMSRARFADHFKRVAGTTPLDYLTDWRIGVAQALLKRGESLKMTAPAAGYSSAAALTRVFVKKLGLSPRDWLEAARNAANQA